jgi:2-succinyl-5-enolpyruvyl-6-hydroxy-3-cyclohexene-1-carboxylate synthase
MGENLCQLYIRQGTDNRNTQGAQKTKLPKINDPVKKWANELNRAFSKEEVQMAKKHMKKCSSSLAIKEMQIKTILRFHLTPVRIVTIKNSNLIHWIDKTPKKLDSIFCPQCRETNADTLK